jgi:hypothetical protein
MATYLTQTGEEWIIDKLDVATRADYVGWGAGTGGSKASSDLVSPSTEARVQGATTQPSADIIQVVSTITCAGLAKTITEAGLFTTAGAGSPPSGGILVLYGFFTGKALDVGDRIEFTFTLEMT